MNATTEFEALVITRSRIHDFQYRTSEREHPGLPDKPERPNFSPTFGERLSRFLSQGLETGHVEQL